MGIEGSDLETLLLALGTTIMVKEERRLPTVDVDFEDDVCSMGGSCFSNYIHGD